jgi:hypothetical protein
MDILSFVVVRTLSEVEGRNETTGPTPALCAAIRTGRELCSPAGLSMLSYICAAVNVLCSRYLNQLGRIE